MKRKKIGEIGVDSGQAMICDPCYVDSEWKSREYGVERLYHVVGGPDIDMAGRRFDEVLPEVGMTMNEAVEQGKVVGLPHKRTHEFSYDGVCRETQSEDLAGQLNYALGHAGAGVAFSTGWGDGVYPVYATYNAEGRIVKVEVLFDEE